MSYFRDGLDDRYFIVPVPLREGVRADLRIPKDMTEAEARKVAAVVTAMGGLRTGSATAPVAMEPSKTAE